MSSRYESEDEVNDRPVSDTSDSYREYSESEVSSKRSGSSGATAFRWLEVLFLFVAFVLMITVNALIDKVSDEYYFGVWGYCSSGVKNSFGIGKLKINSKITGGGCSGRKLGWTFKNIPGLSDDTQEAITEGLTIAFVLHVVAAALIFPALCAAVVGAAGPDSLVKSRRAKSDEYHEGDSDSYSEPDAQDVAAGRRRLRGIVTRFILISFIFTMAVFILDVAGVVLTKNKIHHKSKGIAKLLFGPAFWFVVAAFGLVLISVFIAFIDQVVSVGRHSSQADTRDTSRRTASHRSTSYSSQSAYDSQDGSQYDDVPITPTRR